MSFKVTTDSLEEEQEMNQMLEHEEQAVWDDTADSDVEQDDRWFEEPDHKLALMNAAGRKIWLNTVQTVSS